MQKRITALGRIGVVAALVGGVLIAGCGQEDAAAPSGVSDQPSSSTEQVAVGLVASRAAAAPGDQIVIALEYEGRTGKPVTALEGLVRFDPSSLEYLGEQRVGGAMIITNTTERGTVRFGVIERERLAARPVQLVFRVLRPGYEQGLQAHASMASRLDGRYVESLTKRDGVRVDADLRLVRAERLDLKYWMTEIGGPGTYERYTGTILGIAGGVNGTVNYNNKKYGDATLDDRVDANDAAVVLNAGVGSLADNTAIYSPLITRDAAVAGNVAPPNDVSGVFLDPADTCPVGAEACSGGTFDLGIINANDASVILNGAPLATTPTVARHPIVYREIPGRVGAGGSRVFVNSNITSSQTWTRNNVYQLDTRVTVTNGATLTIEPGTRIEGNSNASGAAALFIARNGRINAVGTYLNPIQFTCTAAVKTKGCWGGIFIAGNAPINEGQAGIVEDNTCRVLPCSGRIRQGEGNAPIYGGTDPEDNSGIMKYVRIEWAGFEVGPDNELNCLTMGGVGRGTQLSYIQCYKGTDDAFEWFGGTVNMDHLVATGTSDDAYDFSFGYNGQVQFGIVEMDPTDSDKAFEGDNTETTSSHNAGDGADPFTYDVQLPLTRPTFVNFTIVGEPTPQTGTPSGNSVNHALHVRRGTAPRMFSFIVTGFPFIALVDDAATCNTARVPVLTNAVFFNNSGLAAGTACPAVNTQLTTGPDKVTGDPLFNRPVNGAAYQDGPDYRLRSGSPANSATLGFSSAQRTTLASDVSGVLIPSDFLQPTTYAGAVPPLSVTLNNLAWNAGWTNSLNTLIRP